MEQTVERVVPRVRVRLDWLLIATILTIKALILVIGALSYQTFANQWLATARGWLEIWNRWDAPHYLDLAQYGYQNSGEIRLFLVFYPLFPWLSRVFGAPFGDYLVGAFLVSTIASLVTAILLQRLVELDYGARLARSAVWFLFIFPTSYFLHIGYTESLFMALMLGCFLAARSDSWLLAGMLGALASLSRVNGLLLIPALAVEALYQYWQTRRWRWQWLWIGLVGLGFGGYLLLNRQVTGDPFAFLAIQREHWYKSLTWPWFGIRETIRAIFVRPPAEALMIGVQESIFIALSLVATILTCWKMRPSYGVWMAGNWLLMTSTAFIMSTPRYVLIMFPIFMLFAQAAQRPPWRRLITVWSLLFMGLFISLFVQGKWAF